MTRRKHISLSAATSVVIANMVGTGVFTSLGFQLLDIRSGFVLLMLWVAGGVAAVCGALCYAELGAALPRSGGEYNFLSRIYHPAVGFMAGWVSATVGFAAPVALAAMTFGAYAAPLLGQAASDETPTALAVGLLTALTFLHVGRRGTSSIAQTVLTAVKVLVILAFCVGATVAVDELQPVTFAPVAGDGALLTSGAFAVSLIYVGYAYTGWNAATYLSDELADPQTALPKILFFGTTVVMGLYVALNAAFLAVTPMETMAGEIEVGYLAATAAFGTAGARFSGFVFAGLLISTVSAMTLAGPRVLQVIGQDLPLFRPLARTNEDGIPFRAIWFQSTLALGFILTATFESVLVLSGFTLALMSFATVLGLFVLRWYQPDLARPFRTSLFPVPPLLFLGLTGWTLVFVLREKPREALLGIALIATGGVTYAAMRRMRTRP